MDKELEGSFRLLQGVLTQQATNSGLSIDEYAKFLNTEWEKQKNNLFTQLTKLMPTKVSVSKEIVDALTKFLMDTYKGETGSLLVGILNSIMGYYSVDYDNYMCTQ